MKHFPARAAALILSLVLLSGCGVRVNWIPGREILISSERTVLTGAEVRLISLFYKTEFENYYKDLLGEDFWEIETAPGISYEDYVKEYFVFRECRALICLKEKAEAGGLSLSIPEEEALDRAAEACFARFTEDEKTFTKANLSDLKELMRLYMIAAKEVRLLSGEEVPVSDEESRVADISVVRLESREECEEFLERLSGGESFMSLAKECTQDDRIDYSVAKKELVSELDEVVFSMQNGETSGPVPAGNYWYIIRVNNSYNLLMSLNNKRNILAERSFERWSAFYEEASENTPIRRNGGLWDSISLNAEGDFPDTGFFAALSEL